tara:strand:+ start:48 stop:506 length:459 start_codon:yes stop_codon:yes gene_type:complete
MIHNVLTEEERIYILNFVNKKLENIFESPGLQTKPNLHTFREMDFFISRIKQYIQGYKIYKCWANFSVGDYIFWHQHPKPVVKSLVYYLVNNNNYGTMFRLKRETEEDPVSNIKIVKCPQNSIYIFDSNLDHSVPCHLKENRISITMDLIKE